MPSQKQPGAQTESGLEGKVGSTQSEFAGVVCGISPVRGGLVFPPVVFSFVHPSANFAESLNFSQGISFLPSPPKYRQQTRNGFF